MNTVIKVDFKQPVKLTGQEQVSLRDIWEQLEQPKQFSQWANQVLKRFNVNTDFGIFNQVVKNAKAGRPRTEFWVTVDAAKKIAMLTNNQAGDRVRDYFLECEKLVYANGLETQVTKVPTLVTPSFMRQIADELEFQTKRADDAEANVTVATKLTQSLINNAVDTALKHSIDTAYISKHYPKVKTVALMWRATQRNRDKYNDNAWVAIYLHTVHEIPKLMLKSKGRFEAYIFNRVDIETINAELPNAKTLPVS